MSRTGFSLIELMVVLAVAAIVLALAATAVGHARESSRSAQARGALLETITTVVSRAAASGGRVVMCPSNDRQVCTEGHAWDVGWIAFHDHDADRERAPGEPIVASRPALPDSVGLVTTPGRTRLVFGGQGGNAGSNVTFTLCDGRGIPKVQSLVISNQGRLRAGVPNEARAAEACARTRP
jgi:type IV fimbrial biogenesis protein FimT